MNQRVITPELLDGLDSGDPDAIRSRRDLRVINQIMRGELWIVNQLKNMNNISKVIELGAGEGTLSRKIQKARPEVSITAVDLAPRPANFPAEIQWLQQDALELDDHYDASTAIVANLFIHHFDDDVIRTWSKTWTEAGAILLAEPYRSIRFVRMGKLMHPFVNHVTRHDMKVSIEAGFQSGDLPILLGDNWLWHEESNMFGSIRCKGVKR